MTVVRTFLTTSLLSLVLAAGACKEPDPYAFETHVANIKDPAKRASGFTGLEELVKTVVTSEKKDERLAEFVEKVIPVLEEVWAEAPEQHEKILLMLRDVARPEAAKIWNNALSLDGSSEARKRSMLALEGIRKAKAVGSIDTVIEQLEKLLENPKNDDGAEEEGGRVRILMCETLGALRDKKAIKVLIKVLSQPRDKQPPSVHRAAATALGEVGQPGDNDEVVDALLTVTFRVPDLATSKNVGVRAKQALVAIGDPAIPQVIKMLRGEHKEVQKLAAEASGEQAGLNQLVIAQTAASILGAMGSPKAVDALLEIYPKNDCVAAAPEPKKEKKEGEEEEDGGETIAFAQLRAVVANALGLIGDPKATDALCQCSLTSKNPGDMFEILGALGRVGGTKAVDCLTVAIKTGVYSDDAVEKPFLLEPRWESARFAILAAGPDDLPKIEEAMAAAAADATVKKELDAWKGGLEVAKKCKADKECFLTTLRDSSADWFAREKAAYEIAKLAEGDPKMAAEIAKAYKVRDADARVTMAWLPAKMLRDKKCPECAAALQAVLDAEKLTTDAKYQAAVLLARDTIAKLGHEDAAAAPAAAKK